MTLQRQQLRVLPQQQLYWLQGPCPPLAVLQAQVLLQRQAVLLLPALPSCLPVVWLWAQLARHLRPVQLAWPQAQCLLFAASPLRSASQALLQLATRRVRASQRARPLWQALRRALV